MLDVSHGPFRDDARCEVERLENELATVRAELRETQDCLSVERDETRILRGENLRLSSRYGVSRCLVLLYGVLRWGLNRGSAAAAGATFVAVLTMTLSYSGHPHSERPRPARHHERTRTESLPDSNHPTMLAAARLFDRWFPLRCYSQLMCHESCASMHDFRLYEGTWGGENPYFLPPYEIEIDLIVSN